MEMNLFGEVRASLRALGLEPGATEADVRSAFRRLALTCHPDVVGQGGALRFQQIAGAYSLLKGLAPDELRHLSGAGWRQRSLVKRRASTFLDWYRSRRDRVRQEAEEARRAEQAEEQRQAEERSERVDRVLEQYDRSLSRRLERMSKIADAAQLNDVLSRLRSSVAKVRRLALGRVGMLINRSEVRQAVSDLLCRWDVDEKTARLVSALPMEVEVLCRLAADVASSAGQFPNSLVMSLLALRRRDVSPDPLLMERYLVLVRPGCVAAILRYWPDDSAPSDAALRRLLGSEDAQVLVPLLAAMKQRFPHAVPRFRGRLKELLEHPAPAVRVWCRVLLAQGEFSSAWNAGVGLRKC